MNRPESDRLVRLVASIWPTFSVTDDVLSAWHFVLADEEPTPVAGAIRHLAKSASGAFAPSLPDIMKAMHQLTNGYESAELAWNKPSSSEFSRAVWQAWGGDRRWGALPDPKYCDDPVEAERTLSFARREFIELYRSMSEREHVEQSALTYERNGKLERISDMKLRLPGGDS